MKGEKLNSIILILLVVLLLMMIGMGIGFECYEKLITNINHRKGCSYS